MDEEQKKEQLAELLKNVFVAGSEKPATSIQIDLKAEFVVLATAAMCLGKEPELIDVSETVRTAFNLENLLFKPDGTFND